MSGNTIGVLAPRRLKLNSSIGFLCAYALAAILGLGYATTAHSLSFPPTTMRQLASEADLIVVAKLRETRSRWLNESKTVIVTDHAFDVEDVIGSFQPFALKTFHLELWGGTLNGRSMQILGMPEFEKERTYLLMLDKDWQSNKAVVPFSGGDQGVFRVVEKNGEKLVAPLVSSPSGGQPCCTSLRDFAEYLKAVRRSSTSPRDKSLTHPGLAPKAPSEPNAAEVCCPTSQKSGMVTAQSAKLPIEVNIPMSDPWSGLVKNGMDIWSDFRPGLLVQRAGSSTPAWTGGTGDNVFDIHGFVDDDYLQRQFGRVFGRASGVTAAASDSTGQILEADIFFKGPDSLWTSTEDESWYQGTSPKWPFRNLALHELGHMWGEKHVAGFPSIMNYPEPGNYGAIATLWVHDVSTLLQRYPGGELPRFRDHAVHLFTVEPASSPDPATPRHVYTESSFPKEISRGESFNLDKVTITSISLGNNEAARIDFSLVDHRRADDPIGSSWPIGSYKLPNSFPGLIVVQNGIKCVVPTDIPPGYYFIKAEVDFGDRRGCDWGISFPFNNNVSFSLHQIQVK
ncbi:MAG: hypothetical protein HY913_16215 [Desulfomonile tiedjei]|nr:hypothetical protein [Desulfomonile tiedjei]